MHFFDCRGNATCDAQRRQAHLKSRVSLATHCVSLRDACAVGERVILRGDGRGAEVDHLIETFSPLWRDYVWGQHLARIAERGTFSSLDSQPQRYCAINSTLRDSDGHDAKLSATGKRMLCTGDADENDAFQHWIEINSSATRAAVNSAAVSAAFHVIFWPVYPQSFGETFANVVISLHELLQAGWITGDEQWLPAAGWFADMWMQPFSTWPVRTLQQLERSSEVACFSVGAVCHLGSFVYDEGDGAGRGGPRRRPWEAMQYIARYYIGRHIGPSRPWWRQSASSTFTSIASSAVTLLSPVTSSLAEGEEVAKRKSGVHNGQVASPLRIVFVLRPGRRKLINAAALAAACGRGSLQELLAERPSLQSSYNSPNRASPTVRKDDFNSAAVRQSLLNCSTYKFGSGLARDLRKMRETDILVGSHGADLTHGLAMPVGSSVIEVRPYLFDAALGLWASYFSVLYGLDDVVHHYAVQVSINDTVGAPRLKDEVRHVAVGCTSSMR